MEVSIEPLSWLQYGYVPTVPAYLVALCQAQDPASSSAPHGHLMKNQHPNGTISPFPAFEDLTYRPTVVSWTASLFPPELHYTCTHGCSPAPSCFSYHISKRWGGGRLGQGEPHGRVSPLGKSAFQGVGECEEPATSLRDRGAGDPKPLRGWPLPNTPGYSGRLGCGSRGSPAGRQRASARWPRWSPEGGWSSQGVAGTRGGWLELGATGPERNAPAAGRQGGG